MYQVNLRSSGGGARPAGITVRAWRAICRDAWRALALFWHEHCLRGHFEKGAEAKYGYQPRKPRYLAQARKRGKPPLFFSGDTYNAVVKGTPLIRAFPSRATLTMNAPPWVKMRPWKSGRPNLGQEITAQTFEELQRLETVLATQVDQGLNEVLVSGKEPPATDTGGDAPESEDD